MARAARRARPSSGLISDGETWMDMIDKRTLCSHTDNGAVVLAIVNAVVEGYHAAFLGLQRRLAERR